jgi:hypothetical protein
LYTFVGGEGGGWRIARLEPVRGVPLAPAAWLDIVVGEVEAAPPAAAWLLRGVTSYERYVGRREQAALATSQPPLGRPEATRAALIPVKKSAAWWALPQDERRAIFEERSAHIRTGLRFLPAIARRLHHSFDLGEPFDFLTWFEYSPRDEPEFERLVALLRETEEWSYVEREVDVRLERP